MGRDIALVSSCTNVSTQPTQASCSPGRTLHRTCFIFIAHGGDAALTFISPADFLQLWPKRRPKAWLRTPGFLVDCISRRATSYRRLVLGSRSGSINFTHPPLPRRSIRHSVAAVTRPPILIAIALLAGCSGGDVTDPPERDGFDRHGRRDLIGLVDVAGEKAGKKYIMYAVDRDNHGSGRAFANYGCATDCSDIRTGYQRAKAASIRDMKLCTGETWGELEGCVAFTQGLAGQVTELPRLDE